MNRTLIRTYEQAKQDLNSRRSQDGDSGLNAYVEMYAWFMKAAGLKQSEGMAGLMTPKQATSDEVLAFPIEAWERALGERLWLAYDAQQRGTLNGQFSLAPSTTTWVPTSCLLT